jgi:glycerol-3-phosphate acyltransferase PlsY
LGDGNPGAANVTREIGIIGGLLVLAGDAGKGVLAILVARWLGIPEIGVLACGAAVVAGHMWSAFFGFRGGGGAATILGVFFILAPLEFAISLAIMAASVFLTRNFGLSVAIGLLPFPIILWAFRADAALIVMSVVLPLVLASKSARNWRGVVRDLARSRRWRDAVMARTRLTWRRKL